MKISFYRLGNMWIALKAIIEKIGVEVVDPPKITKRTLEFGTRHSPESACEPFKYILGEFKDAIDSGADTIFDFNSNSEEGCRLLQYNTGPISILERLGYNIKTIAWGGRSQREVFGDFKKEIPSLTFLKFQLAELFGVIKVIYIEWLEDYVNQLRPYVSKKEKCNKLMEEGLELFEKADSYWKLFKVKRKILKKEGEIPINKNAYPIPVMVVGDLFKIVEPESNYHIFERLGNLDIIPFRSYYLSHGLRRSGKVGPWGKKSLRYRKKFAEPYIHKEMAIGTLASVGDVVIALKKGKIKGIIHTYNFTCMPEIINSVIYKKIAKDFKVPLLSLVSGEHQTEVHQDTRLEAFVDLLKKKEEEK
ncbi:MAG: hypothetical protein ABIH37_05215 [archaeon]